MPLIKKMDSSDRKYAEASIKTANQLRSVATSKELTRLSPLSLPEIDEVVNAVADALPAGNVPSIILSNLAGSPERRPSPDVVNRDLGLLYQGLEQAVDKARHSAKFAGPAAVLWGYQNLLKLAGKETTTSFPQGLWQFYVEYAFREDTARHTVETNGFGKVLRRHDMSPAPEKRVAAWVMAAIQLLHEYDGLLTNRWREQTYIALLQAVTADGPYASQTADLHEKWLHKRPFSRAGADPQHNYTTHRRAVFDAFLRTALNKVDENTRYAWNQQVQIAKDRLPEYIRQMSILAYLDPTPYKEARHSLAIEDACVGLIYQNRYYLIPACRPGTGQPADINTVAAQIAQIMSRPTGTAALQLSSLTTIRRKELASLRPTLNSTLRTSLQALRRAPIIFNADQQASSATLTALHHAERGVGDHAITIFDTQRTIVFDGNPIFFNARPFAALTEIMTQEALSWAAYLHQTTLDTTETEILSPLMMPFERSEQLFIQQAEKIPTKLSAESNLAQVKPLLALRRSLLMRHGRLDLQIDELLLLYRAIHNFTYQPDPDLVAAVAELHDDRSLYKTAEAVERMWKSPLNPGFLIPLPDRSPYPYLRAHPLVFKIPLEELDLLRLYKDTLLALDEYKSAPPSERATAYNQFDQLQRRYLAALAALAALLTQAKDVTRQGSGQNQNVVRMVATLPPAMKKVFDRMSNQSELLNNILQGSELFEWVDMSTAVSSISRLMAAKEDSDQKTLVWSGLLDTHQTLTLTLRDFRPAVVALADNGRHQLATRITEHYLNSYARGLNVFVNNLRRIAKAGRETQIDRPD